MVRMLGCGPAIVDSFRFALLAVARTEGKAPPPPLVSSASAISASCEVATPALAWRCGRLGAIETDARAFTEVVVDGVDFGGAAAMGTTPDLVEPGP